MSDSIIKVYSRSAWDFISFVPVPTAAGFDPATTAWVAAVVAAGGTVSGTEEGYVDTLIKGLKTDGLFSILDRLWILAAENVTQATIDIINLQSWTQHGTVTFNTNAGMVGDGSTGYLDTGFTGGTNYTTNSACVGVYCTNNRTGAGPGSQSDEAGAFSGSGASAATMEMNINPLGGASGSFFQINDSNSVGSLNITTITTSKASWVVTRTGSTARAAYGFLATSGNSNKVSDSQASTSVSTASIFIFAGSNNGSPIRNSNDTLTAVFLGGGLTDTQAQNLSNRINTYMTSLGINIY